jgi:hypothetical protein
MPGMSVHVQDVTDVSEFDAAIAVLVAARERASATARAAPAGPGPTTLDAAVGNLWPRLGGRMRRLMYAAAKLDDWTIIDLSAELSETPGTVRSRRANLVRSLNAVARAYPDAPAFIEKLPSGRSRMHADYRPLVAGRDYNEPLADGSLPND